MDENKDGEITQEEFIEVNIILNIQLNIKLNILQTFSVFYFFTFKAIQFLSMVCFEDI